MQRPWFELEGTDGGARLGRLRTPRGEVPTPVFMPVGTAATVKGMTPRDLRDTGARMVLGNTYHLYLRPGHEAIRELGGLHRFMAWDGPILTDSGGFQVFSLARRRSIEDRGVRFRSHLDGSEHLLTPELAIEVQQALGADIVMPLDVCPSARAPRDELVAAVERSLAWLERCRAAHGARGRQALFGIVQGGADLELRRRSTEATVAQGLDGYAIGGLAVGEERASTWEAVSVVTERLPPNRPRYLMGMGAPEEIVEAVARGVDMFDSVLPTRNARNAGVFTSAGKLNMRNARHRRDERPLDSSCGCYSCRHFSRAYLRHLLAAGEILGPVLLTLHNLRFFLDTMERIRQAIASQRFEEIRRQIIAAASGSADTAAGS